MDDSEDWRSLVCGHIFCGQCIDSLCRQLTQECGLCRARIRTKPERVYIPDYSESEVRGELSALEAELTETAKERDALSANLEEVLVRQVALEEELAVETAVSSSLREQLQKLESARKSLKTRLKASIITVISLPALIIEAILFLLLSILRDCTFMFIATFLRQLEAMAVEKRAAAELMRLALPVQAVTRTVDRSLTLQLKEQDGQDSETPTELPHSLLPPISPTNQELLQPSNASLEPAPGMAFGSNDGNISTPFPFTFQCMMAG